MQHVLLWFWPVVMKCFRGIHTQRGLLPHTLCSYLGFWSECEKQSLAQAVEHYQQLALEEGEEEKVTMLDDIRLPSGVTWDTIAELVPTRNGIQCRKKWHFSLSWSQRGGRRRWGAQDDLKLLQCLSVQDDLADEEEVEWEELGEGWESVRSPHHLRGKWGCLRRVVPNYRIKTFQGLIYTITCTCSYIIHVCTCMFTVVHVRI